MFLSWIAFLFYNLLAAAQPAPILLLNPSFEDDPWHSKPPRAWYYCGQPGESPPDVHPTGYFNVDQRPAHGQTYVGMVVRDNKTWEAVGQRLQQPLRAGRCYQFSLQACRSTHYRSVSRLTGERVPYTDPIRIRLWGGNSNCDHAELLGSSTLIQDTSWTTIHFDLQPSQTHYYFIIEAFYPEDTASDYRGNILIDNCSPILPMDCRNHQPLTEPRPQNFPEPVTRAELEQLIHRLAPKITFGYGAAELTNQYYLDPAQQPVQENLALHQLVLAATHHDDPELEFVVKAPGKYLRDERIRMLESKIQAMGLSPYHFRVRPYRKRDAKEEWAGINGDGDLFIRLR